MKIDGQADHIATQTFYLLEVGFCIPGKLDLAGSGDLVPACEVNTSVKRDFLGTEGAANGYHQYPKQWQKTTSRQSPAEEIGKKKHAMSVLRFYDL
jgi:hypothetical protein